jgi:sulfoxide reductase heme-binding subunit YedZ
VTHTQLIGRVVKPLVFLAALVPAGLLAHAAWKGDLGTNPIEFITHTTGDWTLNFLLITLAITPVRRMTGWNALIRFRRMFGLFAFFYVCLHLTTYLVFDQLIFDELFSRELLLADVAKRPFITMGFLGFVLMLPLALTSTAGWIRRLGGKRWQRLHRLVYVSAIAGVIHYMWLVKVITQVQISYAVVLGLLLAARLWFAFRPNAPARRPIVSPQT